jgi:O-antigen/teichoic acid export membrane protein
MNKKYLLKAAEYAAGNVFNKIILILFIPIFTTYFLPEEYAVHSNLLVFIAFASLVYSLGLQQSIFSYFYDKHDEEYQFTFINTVFITIISFGFLFTLLIILFQKQLSQLLLRTPEFHYLFWYIAAIIFCDNLYTMTLSFLNILEKSRNFALLSSVKTVLLLLFFILLAILKEFNLRTVFFATFLSAFVSAIIAMLHMKHILNVFAEGIQKIVRFSPLLMKEALSFGIIMVPGTLAMLGLKLADRYMLTYLVSDDVAQSLHEVGIYSLGYRVGMIMQFLVSLISLVYFPYAMKISQESWAKKSYKKMFHSYLLFGSLFAFLIMLFSYELFSIFVNDSYFAALQIVGYGVISSFLSGIFNLLNISFYITKKAKAIALAVLLGAILNIVLNFIMIPRFGIHGAGIASIIAYFFIVVFEFWQAERLFKVGYYFFNFLLSFFFLIIMMNYQNVYHNSSLFLIKSAIAVGIGFGGFLFFRKFRKNLITNK